MCVVGLVTRAVFDEEWILFILLVLFFVLFLQEVQTRDIEIAIIHEKKKLQMFEKFSALGVWRVFILNSL